MIKIKRLASCLSVILLLLVSTTGFAKTTTPLSQRKDVARFIQTMVKQHHFKKADLNALFNKVDIRHDVISKMNTPYESKPWPTYRAHFLTKDRIEKGARFWQKHETDLTRAEKRYGVPASIIVAIIGVESKYGKRQGTHRVIDALTTIAFNYPKRSKFFRKELTQFLLLCRELNIKPDSVLGSYAGAIGQPQFMPSSYRAYAVDFSKNGKRDLRNNPVDVIGSIANYLKQNGWQAGQGIVEPARIKGKRYKRALSKSSKPRYTVAQLKRLGVKQKDDLTPKTKVSLIQLKGKRRNQYWLGLNNFYVITRYNTSKLYAMAVTELSQRIKRLHQRQLSAKKDGAKHAA